MTCFVCHRSLSTRAKKCPLCGAPAALNSGDFLFEINTADKNQLKKYYDKSRESANDNSARTTQSTPASTTASSSTRSTQSTPASTTTSSSTRTTQSTTASTAETGTSRSSPGANAGTRNASEAAVPMARRISGFLETHGLTVLEWIWAVPFLFTIAFVAGWTDNYNLSFVIAGLTLLFSAYLIYAQMCYSSLRTTIFWICTAITIIFTITRFFSGHTATEAANATVTAWVNEAEALAETYGTDVVGQLTHFFKFSYYVFALEMQPVVALVFLNWSLVHYEKKKNTFRRILAIIGIAAFLWFITEAAYYAGYYPLLRQEMTNYFATAFPGQTIVF